MSIMSGCIFLTIKLSGDIEENPGPQSKPCNNLSICHWNLNSFPALLRAYISVNKFEIRCHSETSLDSSISSNDGDIKTTR